MQAEYWTAIPSTPDVHSSKNVDTKRLYRELEKLRSPTCCCQTRKVNFKLPPSIRVLAELARSFVRF